MHGLEEGNLRGQLATVYVGRPLCEEIEDNILVLILRVQRLPLLPAADRFNNPVRHVLVQVLLQELMPGALPPQVVRAAVKHSPVLDLPEEFGGEVPIHLAAQLLRTPGDVSIDVLLELRATAVEERLNALVQGERLLVPVEVHLQASGRVRGLRRPACTGSNVAPCSLQGRRCGPCTAGVALRHRANAAAPELSAAPLLGLPPGGRHSAFVLHVEDLPDPVLDVEARGVRANLAHERLALGLHLEDGHRAGWGVHDSNRRATQPP
mmetsp:Transcript_141765/g.395252  ORF Transcript_141765/g.395252 Transcript_141765/m.395252 type:complete len:266 (+) Transcript_141765:232-1029(+)